MNTIKLGTGEHAYVLPVENITHVSNPVLEITEDGEVGK